MERERRTKRWPIILGVAATAAVCAGVGFSVWHGQPGFCNAVCHEPMDNYVEGYTHDTSLLAYAHAQENTACLDCHEPTIEEQVSEGLVWVRGDFATDAAGSLATVGVTADAGMCARAACHSLDEAIAATQDWGGEAGVNPHSSHQGIAIDCSNCHSTHSTSYMYCNTCHEYEVPAGWSVAAGAGR